MRDQEIRKIQYKGNTFVMELIRPYYAGGRQYYEIVDLVPEQEVLALPDSVEGIAVERFCVPNLQYHEKQNEYKYAFRGVKRLEIPKALMLSNLNNLNFPELEEVFVDPDSEKYATDGKMLLDKSRKELLLALVGAGEGAVAKVPEYVKVITRDAFHYARCKDIIFENPDVQLVGNPFESSSWYEEKIREGKSIYIGNLLFRAEKTDDFVLDEKATRFYETAFSSGIPKKITSHIVPRLNLMKPGYGYRSYGGACEELVLTSSRKVNWDALSKWSALAAVRLPNHKKYKDIDGVVFSKDGKTLVFYPQRRRAESYRIPDGVRMIEKRAFSGQKYVKWIDMPDSVQTIRQGAFCECDSLEGVRIAAQVRELPDATVFQPYGVFENCVHLRKVQLPEKLEHIGADCFYGARNLTEIEIPKTVRMIGKDAFRGCGLSRISLPKNLRYVGEGALCFAQDSSESDEIIVEAYEGTARGLVAAIEAVDPDNAAMMQWHPAKILMRGSKGEIRDTIVIPGALKTSAAAYIDSAWNAPKFDYAEYDECFAEIQGMEEKVDFALSAVLREGAGIDPIYEGYLRKMGLRVAKGIVAAENEKRLVDFLKMGVLSKTSLKQVLSLCNQAGMNTASAYVLRQLGKESGGKDGEGKTEKTEKKAKKPRKTAAIRL